MFCTNCGGQVDGSMAFCTKCGSPVLGRQRTPTANGEVKSHMLGAILQTVICIPAGILPLIYACQVNSKLAQGDISGAQEASKKALMWINITTAVFGALFLLAIIGNLCSKP